MITGHTNVGATQKLFVQGIAFLAIMHEQAQSRLCARDYSHCRGLRHSIRTIKVKNTAVCLGLGSSGYNAVMHD